MRRKFNALAFQRFRSEVEEVFRKRFEKANLRIDHYRREIEATTPSDTDPSTRPSIFIVADPEDRSVTITISVAFPGRDRRNFKEKFSMTGTKSVRKTAILAVKFVQEARRRLLLYDVMDS